MQRGTTIGHVGQLTAVVGISIGSNTVSALCPHTIGIVGKCPCGSTLGHGSELTTLRPSVVPCAVRCKITYGVIRERFAVVGCEQIAPFCVSVTIGNGAGS